MVRLSVLVLSLTLLSGCGADQDEPTAESTAESTAAPSSSSSPSSAAPTSADPEPSPTGTRTPPDTSPEAAQAAYADALALLMSADTGHVESGAALAEDFSVKVDADYEISSSSSAGVVGVGGFGRAAGAPGVDARTTWAATEGWYQRTDGEGRPIESCWTRFDATDPPVADDRIRAAPLGFPAALAVLESGTGVLRIRNDVRVEVDLFRLALVYGPAVATLLGLEREGQGVGSINVELSDDGRIEGWSTTSGDFLRAVEQAGLEVPGPLADFRSSGSSGFFLAADFTEQGAPVDVAAPPKSERCAA